MHAYNVDEIDYRNWQKMHEWCKNITMALTADTQKGI